MLNDTEKDRNCQPLLKWIDKSTVKKRDCLRATELGVDVMKPSRLQDMEHCGDMLTFLHDENMEKSVLETGFFCRNRICPACAWRKAGRDAVAMACIMQEADEMGYGFLFATLTAKNVPGNELSEAVKDYTLAYTEMMRRGKFKLIAGAIRKLEITYNRRTDEYHPHIHSVWIVPKRWRDGDRYKDSISADELAEAWRSALKGKYQVDVKAQDIRMVRSARQEDILEFAKYPAKAGDYLYSKDTFETFYGALKGVRLITPMRLAKKLKTAYKAGELDRWKETDTTEYVWRTVWNWWGNDYVMSDAKRIEKPIVLGVCEYDSEVMDD